MARPRAETPTARTAPTAPPPGSTLAIVAAAVATVVFWGSAFAGIRAGLHSYSPTHLALLRFLVASLVLGVYALATRMRLPAPA